MPSKLFTTKNKNKEKKMIKTICKKHPDEKNCYLMYGCIVCPSCAIADSGPDRETSSDDGVDSNWQKRREKMKTLIKKTPKFDLAVPFETRLRFLKLPRWWCSFCGGYDEKIACYGCGKEIAHCRSACSISHYCLNCNYDLGKGE